jgi:SAM-dependent methyltransferase
MAHQSQIDFMLSVKSRLPQRFQNCRVLDIGSLDLNGNNRYLFENYKYLGVDIGYGNNVDLVCPGHKVMDGEGFDVVISTECLEHDEYWIETLTNMVNLTKKDGLVLLSCATTGRPEHGTEGTSPADSPFTKNYYRNISTDDIQAAINIPLIFKQYELKTITDPSCDLYFWGIKK